MKTAIILALILIFLVLASCGDQSADFWENTHKVYRITPEEYPDYNFDRFVGVDWLNYLCSNPNGAVTPLLRNPDTKIKTYSEVIEWIKADNTDLFTYDRQGWSCGDCAARVFNNAQNDGIRCGIVRVQCTQYKGNYRREIRHVFNCFLTSDRGMVFIDSTNGGMWPDFEMDTTWKSGQPSDKIIEPFEIGEFSYIKPIGNNFEYQTIGRVNGAVFMW